MAAELLYASTTVTATASTTVTTTFTHGLTAPGRTAISPDLVVPQVTQLTAGTSISTAPLNIISKSSTTVVFAIPNPAAIDYRVQVDCWKWISNQKE